MSGTKEGRKVGNKVSEEMVRKVTISRFLETGLERGERNGRNTPANRRNMVLHSENGRPKFRQNKHVHREQVLSRLYIIHDERTNLGNSKGNNEPNT